MLAKRMLGWLWLLVVCAGTVHAAAPEPVAAIERAALDDPAGLLGPPVSEAAPPAQRLDGLVRQAMGFVSLERFDEAAAVLPVARELAGRQRDDAMQCLIATLVVYTTHEREGWSAAQALVEPARQAAQRPDLRWCEARLQRVIGLIHIADGRRAAGLESLQAATAAFEAQGDTLMLANVRSELAWAYSKSDDESATKRAIEQGEEALAGLDPERSRSLASSAHHNFAWALLAASRWNDAGQHAALAARYAEAIGDTRGLAYVGRLQGVVEMKLGRPAAALERFSRARRFFQDARDPTMTAYVAALEAEALVALGRPAAALRLLAEMEPLRKQINLPGVDIYTYRVSMEASAAAHDEAGVVSMARAYADALQRRERSENRRVAAELRERYQSDKREKENLLLRGQQEVQRTRLVALAALLGLAALLVAGLAVHLVQQRRLRASLQQRTEQLENSRQALRELGAHNVRLLEDERKRVARELHDELGQQLAAMRMEMAVLKARAEAGQAPDPGQWVQMRERLDRLTASMRSLVQDLRPPALDGGLEAALQWLAAQCAHATGVSCQVEVAADARGLKPEAQIMAFRVAQESINNVMRHAHAGSVSLQLQHGSEGWDLRVTDDGDGFDTAGPRGGFGLLSMEERARLMGATLHIDSRPGRGTCVHLHLPQIEGAAPVRDGGAGSAR